MFDTSGSNEMLNKNLVDDQEWYIYKKRCSQDHHTIPMNEKKTPLDRGTNRRGRVREIAQADPTPVNENNSTSLEKMKFHLEGGRSRSHLPYKVGT